MTAVRDLPFAHRVVLHGGGPHWERVEAQATAPLTTDGLGAFIRWSDEMATRYGYADSRWAVERGGAVEAEVLVYAVEDGADATSPRGAPGRDDRFRQLVEVYATTGDGGSAADPGPRLWARRGDGGPLVPAVVTEAPGEAARVRVLGAGVLPPTDTLLLARPGLLSALGAAAGPVATEVHACTHATRRTVEDRVLAGRGRPTAVLALGTLEQFRTGEGDIHG
ncbi:hypothetical protein [Georgenia wangjunii]|uniref:hypothetical protein n=1 Tax=Georgenia wangjunii TaxID=3117730 RepID=UPI002F26B344